MRDLRRIAQSPGEFEWRMELLAKMERINQRHDLFSRACVAELKKLNKEKLGIKQVNDRVIIELDARLKPVKSVAKTLGKGAIWVIERMLLLGFAYLGIKLGLKQ